MATPTASVLSADQTAAAAAAAAYEEQYQQYTQQYQAWLAANPGYHQQQQQPEAAPGTSALDYSAYYQQYPSQQTHPGQQSIAQNQQALTPEQQYAQQYAAYYAQYGYTVPPTSGAPSTTLTTSAATSAAQTQQYQDYYAQQAQQQAYSQQGKSGPPSSHQGKSVFDYQAFQKQKHLEAEERRRKFQEEQERQNHIQKRLNETTLNEPVSGMAKSEVEKPAYLSVKSKKVKPLTTNILESKDPEPSPTLSKENWPQSLKNYVVRFFNTVAVEDQDAAQEDLRAMVAKFHAEGKLFKVDWDSMEVPSKYRKKSARKESPEHLTLGAEERARREKRARRFEEDSSANQPVSRKQRVEYAVPFNNGDVIDLNMHTIVGTSTKLEKNYRRLTEAPDPSTVRPLHVLRQTLELLKKKWQNDENYAYICDQLKSVRQDLTVQRIKNEFTVAVYEIHARIALERGDLGEFNQCQTQLKQLYEENLPGNMMEFTAYRILYQVYTRNPADIIAVIRSLTAAQKEDSAVKHALQVRTAVGSSNYYSLFTLYQNAPNMSGFLMDQFVDRERIQAMARICMA
ncbi:hypothetical protein EDD11_009489, partial [Mortierella claussenii]